MVSASGFSPVTGCASFLTMLARTSQPRRLTVVFFLPSPTSASYSVLRSSPSIYT
jgi:hypothetical protein